MQEKDVVAVIRHLIETLEDGSDGFRIAADSVGNVSLKILFAHYARQFGEFSVELHRIADAHGEGGQVEHHGWPEIRELATIHDPAAILHKCEREEDHALAEYRRALAQPLPRDVETVIGAQSLEVRAALNKVRCLRVLAGSHR